jgi:hypothetical protein
MRPWPPNAAGSSVGFNLGQKFGDQFLDGDDLMKAMGILAAENKALIHVSQISADESLGDAVAGFSDVACGKAPVGTVDLLFQARFQVF